MADLKLTQTPDDADIILNGNDLVITEGLHNMPLLALFGGNPGNPTEGAPVNGIENFDWWGNYILNVNDPKVWFNSYLENLLDNIVITPINLDKITQTVKKDLKFLSEYAVIDVACSIPYVDTLKIFISIVEKDTGEENEFSYIWNATKNELINQSRQLRDGISQ